MFQLYTNDIPVVIVKSRSSIALVKTASTTGSGGCDTINYTFAIANTGTTTLAK
jgi:hypothetical protein